MSVRSIRDPSTGEFLVPTDAIKRQLLDPYKGLFINPQSGEHMPISEAIQKGKLTLLPSSLFDFKYYKNIYFSLIKASSSSK